MPVHDRILPPGAESRTAGRAAAAGPPPARRWARWARSAPVALAFATVLCAWLTGTRLRLSSDMSTLLPRSGAAAALARYTRAFGGREPAVVLVTGERPDEVALAADGIAAALRRAPSIARVLDRAPMPDAPTDPTLAWAYAGPEARARLAALVTPEGMRARLEDTRALLLAPATDERVQAWLARDPLRLWQVPWESRAELAAGVASAPG